MMESQTATHEALGNVGPASEMVPCCSEPPTHATMQTLTRSWRALAYPHPGYAVSVTVGR